MERYKEIIRASIDVKTKMLNDDKFLMTLDAVVDVVVNAYRHGKKVLAAGNGGSAADAQHFVAEYVGRFGYDRPALAGIALTVDTSVLTAIGNDYGYDMIFSRQIEANAQEGDVFFAISTSGNSPSIVKALEAAQAKGVICVGLTGIKPSKMDNLCDYIFKMPSADTPRIQEGHFLVEHTICEMVEKSLFPR